MKVVILAGGYGTRISEESHLKPKPMLEIGGKPILWHIMKEYSFYGYNEFIICAGYKQHIIKEWFSNYAIHNSDITIDFLNDGKIISHTQHFEPWKVTIVDTGLNTMTGGRVKRIQEYVGREPFMLTYGDGVSNVNISELVKFHESNNSIATITAATVAQRFGILDIDNSYKVTSFREKNVDDKSRINAGYMVLNPEIFDYIGDDFTVFEKEPLEKLAKEGRLSAYMFDGFWQCMDTKREMDALNAMWEKGTAPWKLWE